MKKRHPIPEALYQAIAAVSGRKLPSKNKNGVSASKLCPISVEIKRTQKKPFEPGELVKGQGIYLGRWEAKDSAGYKIGKTFNVFAAPCDLKGRGVEPFAHTYAEAAHRIAEFKKWHGFAGSNIFNQDLLCQALQNGSYNGEWVIPPCDLLTDVIGGDYFHKYQHSGAFEGQFKDEATRTPFITNGWYWSSACHPTDAELMSAGNIVQGSQAWYMRGWKRLRCRPVRLVEISS